MKSNEILMCMAGLLCVAGAIYAFKKRSDYERGALSTRFVKIADRRIGKKFRLVFLSDLHGNTFGEGNSLLAQCVKDTFPDAVLMGGDMVTAKEYIPKNFEPFEKLLENLQGIKCPVYYAEGNHELRMRENVEIYPGWYDELRQLLEAHGVRYLDDETVDVGANISVSGLKIEPEYYAKLRLKPMDKGYVREHLHLNDDTYNVVMAHTPQYMKTYWSEGANLVLSGHFHGGTVVLPLIGPLMSPQLIMHPKYANGASLRGERKSVTSAGLGTHSINIRINNKPEIVVIDLMPEE
ncbi:MAG: metallophosphoesterase [Lachnospiraceae bacterium]|nr:metallophosphoesterase [Lachnospiraceae bacterium]